MINTVVVVKHTTGVPETSSLPMQVHSLGHLAKEFAEWFWKTVSEEKKDTRQDMIFAVCFGFGT
jgi:hypothetical protein